MARHECQERVCPIVYGHLPSAQSIGALPRPAEDHQLRGQLYAVLQDAVIDCVQWEQETEALPLVGQDTILAYRELLQQYSGDYLADCTYLWAEGERQRLRSLWLHLVNEVADYYVADNDFPAALEVYHRQVNVYPRIESGYYMLMRLYAELGDRNAVEATYAKLCDMTQNEFGIPPQAAYQSWYEQWSGNEKR